jgi:hypothetical protein
MKILATHEFPHLDDIAAIWLWKKYVPGWNAAKIVFLELKGGGLAVTYKNKPVDSDPNVIHFGVGKGKFDEHKGDIGICATMLTFMYLKKHKHIPKQELPGVQGLVEFVNLQDTGKLGSMPHSSMYLPSLLRNIQPSHKRQEIGQIMLDSALIRYTEKAEMEKIIKKGTELSTKWGKGLAITTAVQGPEHAVYQAGYVFMVHRDPQTGWLSVRSQAGSNMDMTDIYNRVHALEPKAGWFLHHAKNMLMCGSRSAPNVVRSKLSLKQLVDIVHDSSRAN